MLSFCIENINLNIMILASEFSLLLENIGYNLDEGNYISCTCCISVALYQLGGFCLKSTEYIKYNRVWIWDSMKPL